MKENHICIIPARGGSKRIPKKNIKDFLGKPIIAYSIEAAIKSGIYDEIMVSTDSDEIAEVARKFGAVVPFFRENSLADDFTTTDDVILHVLEQYQRNGRKFKYMTCLYATAPFVSAESIQQAMKLMTENEGATEILPMVAFSFPPQRCHIINANGMASFKYPQYVSTRSQDLEKWYHDAGQFYIYDSQKFIDAQGRIVDHIVPYIIDEMSVQDIDTETDWKLAELKYKMNHKMEI